MWTLVPYHRIVYISLRHAMQVSAGNARVSLPFMFLHLLSVHHETYTG